MSDWINHENTNHRINGLNEDGTQMPHTEHDASRNCPFCLVPAASPMHVASHLHRVASFALPRSGGDEDMPDGSKQSDQAEVRTRESQLSEVTLSNGTGSESGNDLSRSDAEHVSSFSFKDLRKIGTGNDTELSNVHSFLGALDAGSSFDSAIFHTIPDDGSQSKGQSGEATASDVPKEASDGNAEPPIDDNRTGKDKGPGEIPAPYDATDDALALRDALGQADVNTKTLIQVLPHRTHAEILELRKRYKDYVKVHGKGVNIAKHINIKLNNSTLAKACYATAVGRWESESYWASHYCTNSSYHRLLIESLFGRSNSEIRYIKESFKGRRYDSYASLEKCMKGELKAGKFRTAVLLALKEGRQSENDPIDPELVTSDVQGLRSALRKGDGDAMAMIHIIVRRSDSHLREVLRAYKRLYEQNFPLEIVRKFQNVVGELLAHILNGAINRPMRDALLLHEALWDSPSDNEWSILLISRLVRLHWEPQHLVKVKAQYYRRYDHPLEDAIAGEILPSSVGSEWGEFCIQLLRSSEMHAVKA
ncbi:uncharacterized protein APUU_50202A [Aspergillus puulaauensis]|uniref:Annexin ANXC4 n=1 Tax=Aspergillus puulaauensis TaxID=1220207 RepID=A0A7R7XPT5_9EURO|nr:uncharacterized protein APUU_50202A [Aspergillus puulaauensis]BCS25491.1 hypothetical protein APUU_50202A [Aspergillus puulaauensis]